MRLDHLLSKEQLARVLLEVRVQSHVLGERPEMAAHCGALVIRSSSSLKPVSTALRGWKGGGGTAWPSTLLGPEGTGVEPISRTGAPRLRNAAVRAPGPPVS